ncbi:MAG: cold-shock protein [Sphingomicrobium sp.]
MKTFGTVKSFDSIKGHGEIKPEAGGDVLPFLRGAFSWAKDAVPTVGQRLSYDVGTNNQQPCALNLQTI